jgi:hypothetical protein
MSQSPQAQAKVNPAPTIAEVMGAERQRAAARTRYAANSTQRAAHTLYTPPVPPAGLSLRLTWVDVVCLLQAVKRMEEDMPPNGLTDLIEKLENLDAVFQDINRRE